MEQQLALKLYIVFGAGLPIGAIAQVAMTALIGNGEYAKLSSRKKFGIVLAGGLSSIIAALMFQTTIGFSLTSFEQWIFGCLLSQFTGGVAGAEGLRKYRATKEGSKP